MKERKIYFRADGNATIGLGHLYRSSALAAMLNETYTCSLITRCDNESVMNAIGRVYDSVTNLSQDAADEITMLAAIMEKNALVVLDGYHFDSAYQEKLVAKGFELFCIDDIHAYRFYASVIINHAGGLTPQDYSSLATTQYYLGPRYALLQQPFLDAAAERRKGLTDRNCFICFGGADPQNKTLEVLLHQAFATGLHFDQLHVVIGNANPHKEVLEDFVKERHDITLHIGLTTEQMLAVMRRCSFGVCSPSTVVYEYLSVGGIVFLEQIADNQKDVIKFFTTEGIAFGIDRVGKLTTPEINTAFSKGAELFDGKSGERFLKIFTQFFNSRELTVRKVQEGDLQHCFEWANDPQVRNQSYSQEPISMEDHVKWFNTRLADTHSYFYILEFEGTPAAQIRFQVSGNEAVLGYLASASIRSKGLGTAILGKGIEAFLGEYQRPVTVIGYVKNNNLASQRSFEKLSFTKSAAIAYPDSVKYTMHYGN